MLSYGRQSAVIPYYLTLSIKSKTDDVQWIKSQADYLNLDLYDYTGRIGNAITLPDPYAETMGIFLAPHKEHIITAKWGGKTTRKYLPDGSYLFNLCLCLEEDIYFDDLLFIVELN